jgi:2-polyprenyl-6-methoxyphenol hydroxylase-like FAD-dependent oxidoreductase
MSRILISGAGIAGLALANSLRGMGWQITLIEQSPTLRVGGQAIDIRGVAIEVASRLGVLEELRARRLQTRGLTMIDRDGNVMLESDERTLTGGYFADHDIEVIRDELVEVLFGAFDPDPAQVWFSDTIVDLAQDSDGVNATTQGGRSERFDFVFGADGINSPVRRGLFGDDRANLRYLNRCVANITVPNTIGLDLWQYGGWETEPRWIVYPSRDNQDLRAFVLYDRAEDEPPPADRKEQMALIAAKAAGLPWKVPEILADPARYEQFYFGDLAWVDLPCWSQGRVVLVGDAAHCPTPMTGQGTSLALVGAFVLGQELRRHGDDYATAFARYEERMRPFVAANLKILDAHKDNGARDAISYAKNAFELDG